VSLVEIADRRAKAETPTEVSAWQRIEADLRRRRGDAMLEGRSRIRRALEKDLAGRIAAAVDERLRTIRSTSLRQALDARIESAWQRWSECLQSAEQSPSVESVHALRIATSAFATPSSSAAIFLVHVRLAFRMGSRRAKIARRLARPGNAPSRDRRGGRAPRSRARGSRSDARGATRPRPRAARGTRDRRELVALARPDDAFAAIAKWRKPARVAPPVENP